MFQKEKKNIDQIIVSKSMTNHPFSSKFSYLWNDSKYFKQCKKKRNKDDPRTSDNAESLSSAVSNLPLKTIEK